MRLKERQEMDMLAKTRYLKSIERHTATYQAMQREFESLDLNKMSLDQITNKLYGAAMQERETIAKNEKELQNGLRRLQEWNTGSRRRYKRI